MTGIGKKIKSISATGSDFIDSILSETAWMLEQAGFAVLLPSWWTKKGGKQRISVLADVKSPPLQAGGGLNMP